MNTSKLEEMMMWVKAVAITCLMVGTPVAAYLYATQEVSSTVTTFEWKMDGKGWRMKGDKLPSETIKSPYGFMHNQALMKTSYTLVIPRNRVGFTNEARIHIWK